MEDFSYQTKFPFFRSTTPSHNTYVLDVKYGNVYGDGTIERVFLTGHKSYTGGYFTDNITLMVQNISTLNTIRIPLQSNAGYSPRLFLGDFTGDKADDILVTIDSGGSGGYIFSYIYTFKNYHPVLIFDYGKFNRMSLFDVNYKDNFKVTVKAVNRDYSVDLDVGRNKKTYVDLGIYNEEGKLLTPTQGSVLGLGALYPVNSNYNGPLDFQALQRIIGITNADTLGYVQSTMRWDGSRFKQVRINTLI